MNRYCKPAVCRHIKLFGELGPPFCNHYSYNCDFVNFNTQWHLGPRMDADLVRILDGWGFQVLDEAEEDVDVDGFGDEGEIAGGESALAVFFARVA